MEVIDSTVAKGGLTNVQVVGVVEAKRHFSDLMARVAYSGERLIVERHGKPVMAWVSVADLQRLQALEHNSDAYARRMAALALADASRARIAAEHNGAPLPDSTEIIYALREGRLDE
jgi:prevent-host-death family protein